MGVKEGIDPRKPGEAGWGIIFAEDADPAIKEALKVLLDLRQEQAGDRFRLYEGPNCFRPGKDTQSSFLARNGAGPGPADPEKVPYYLLIVGSLEEIPYRFQQQLDVQYAVGRIHFDTLEEYAQYARSVVMAETGKVALPRRTTFFGVQNPDDRHTQLTTNLLVRPLVASLAQQYPGRSLEMVVGFEASKARLVDLLHEDEGPDLLVTTGHGVAYPADDPRRHRHQGALLCADWPGPRQWRQPLPPDFYFSADDITSSMRVQGKIALHYSAFSAGTIGTDDFAPMSSKRALSPKASSSTPSFIARLAQRLLSHPQGGALAVIGLVERSWAFSFDWPGASANSRTRVFESILQRLLDGFPVGSAVEFFNEQWAELATVLSDELEDIQFGKQFDPYELASMWTTNNDARNFMIVGDPAVRLQLSRSAK